VASFMVSLFKRDNKDRTDSPTLLPNERVYLVLMC
jgi:hypothetical protein